ncbi:MAG: hypothetical protein JW959_13505 [Pirellulales bacterium]|nr:hypothetical protein [Pirellulales bacterium]
MNNTVPVERDIPFGQEKPSGYSSGSIVWILRDIPGGIKSPVHPRQCIGLAFLFPVSSLTASVDPWVDQQKERLSQTTETTTSPSSFSTRRRVTLSEAKTIAQSILFKAEERRRQTAEAEAARGINWEEWA